MSQRDEFPEIITLLMRFEQIRYDLPANKKQAEESSPEVIERKVHTICEIRKKTKAACAELEHVETVILPV